MKIEDAIRQPRVRSGEQQPEPEGPYGSEGESDRLSGAADRRSGAVEEEKTGGAGQCVGDGCVTGKSGEAEPDGGESERRRAAAADMAGHQRQATHAENDGKWLRPSHRMEHDHVSGNEEHERGGEPRRRSPADARGENTRQGEQRREERRVEPPRGVDGIKAGDPRRRRENNGIERREVTEGTALKRAHSFTGEGPSGGGYVGHGIGAQAGAVRGNPPH